MNDNATKNYRVVWRKKSNRFDREIFYCAADNEEHAWQRCRDYIKREFQVRFPVFIEVREMS
jgi:hypothetical protein